LPSEFDQLTDLKYLDLRLNFLDEPLQEAADRGSSDVLAYLRNPFWYQWRMFIIGGVVLAAIAGFAVFRWRSRQA
jgi:hypothetical protein